MSSNVDDAIIAGLNLDVDPALLTFLGQYDELPAIPIRSLHQLLDNGVQRNDAKDLGKKKSWHQRRREEIVRLCGEMKELLTILQRQRVNASFRTTFVPSQASRSGWTSLSEIEAMRELMCLQKSTKENAKLRELVRHRDLQIKSIERAFKRRMRVISSIVPCQPKLSCTDLLPSSGNTSVFNDLIVGMDEVYADVDNFLNRVKMYELPCPGRRNDSTKYRERNVFVELLDCYKVPFDLRQTEKAIWTLKTTPAGESNAIASEYFAVDENTRLKTVCGSTRRHDIKMHVVVHVAVRKYTEQDRTVFITRTLVEPIQELFPVAFKETTRLVLKPGKSSATGAPTVIQTHCRAIDYEKLDHRKTQRAGRRHHIINKVLRPGSSRSQLSTTKWRIC